MTRHTNITRTTITRTTLLVALSVLLSIPLVGPCTTAVGQYVNGFGRTTNPYSSRKTNPYAGIYSSYGMPKSAARPNPYAGGMAMKGNTFGYHPQVQKPFAGQHRRQPLVTSDQFARREIMSAGWGY